MSIGDLLSGNQNTANQIAQLMRGPQPQPTGGPPSGPGAPTPQAPPSQPMPPSAAAQPPPDLASLYLKLQGQDRAAAGIDRGLAGMAAALSAPGTSQNAWNAMPPPQDPGQQLGTMMQLMQMQNMANMPVPSGMDPNTWRVMPPDAKLKYIEAQGAANIAVAQKGAETKQQDIIDAQTGLSDANKTLTSLDANIDKIKTAVDTNGRPVLENIMNSKSTQRAAMNIMNATVPKDPTDFEVWKHSIAQQYQEWGLTQPEIDTIMLMKQTSGQQYADALNSIKGSRRTQVEVGAVAGGLSQINNVNQSYDDGKGGGYLPSLNKFQNQVRTTLANSYGAAGQLDSLDPKYRFADGKPLVDPIYRPGGDLYGGKGGDWVNNPPPGPAGTPVQITGPADIAKLPKGTPFIIPSGPNQGKTGYAQ
jgi:hypothetical protein